MSSTCGSYATARAIATRCCIPPESCHGYLPPSSPRPTAARSSRTSSRRRPSRRASPCSGSSTFSATVIHGNSDAPVLLEHHRHALRRFRDRESREDQFARRWRRAGPRGTAAASSCPRPMARRRRRARPDHLEGEVGDRLDRLAATRVGLRRARRRRAAPRRLPDVRTFRHLRAGTAGTRGTSRAPRR